MYSMWLNVKSNVYILTPALPAPHLQLKEDSYDLARQAAPGWDVYGLEGEWRDWVAKKEIRPINPDAHFLAFCKRRGRYPGFKQQSMAT